jgi:hypothetical protein
METQETFKKKKEEKRKEKKRARYLIQECHYSVR